MAGKRGFASMSPEKRRAIASLGGKAAHQGGKAHEWDSLSASVAGRKGGTNAAKRRKELRDAAAAHG